MAKIVINIDRCVNNGDDNICCPYAGSAHTPGSGYATDYFCKLKPDKKAEHGFRGTSGYVEWDSEINPIPKWCPILAVEEKVLNILESESGEI